MKILMIMALSLTTLAACNSSSNNDDDDTGATSNQLKVFAAKNANDEPKIIENAGNIKNDINKLFNSADAEPISVKAGDSVQDVINRAGG
jgi:hypothetical protein